MNDKNDKNDKKQIPLRLSKRLYEEVTRWAEEDFRSLNGQIEYLLTEAVLSRRKSGARSLEEEQTEEPCGTEQGENA